MVDVEIAPNSALRSLLDRHPHVDRISERPGAALAWTVGERRREVRVGDAGAPLLGLPELVDNNPLVCADVFSVPNAATTLACIALGPLILAGLLTESPTMLTSVACDDAVVEGFLAAMGWRDGIAIGAAPTDFKGAAAATVMAAISTPERLDDLDDLYRERYSRSFFVVERAKETWDVEFVVGKPYAAYRLRIAPDEPTSLLTIQTMGDLDGKLGAAQIIHAFNVMNGFEESLGI